MRRFLSALCALSVLLSMICLPTFAAAENGGQSYGSLQDALDNYTSGVIVLKEDAQNIAVSRDVYLDLNGHTVEGVTVTGGTLYCMDSQTDDFTVEDGKGYGTVSGVRGSIAPVTTQSGYAKHGYLMVTREEKTSFHCVNLEIFAMTLRPSVAGVYFRSHFAADEVAAEEIDSFGIALSLAGVPTAENMGTRGSYTAFTGFLPGPAGNETAANGTILTGVMKESNTDDINDRNANMDVYGAAYIRTESGILFGKPVQRDLLTQVKGIDDNWSKLNATQKSAINGMYDAFSGAMSRWGLVNIGKGPAGGDDSITLPISVVTEDGVVSQETVVTAEDISVTVPAGVQLAPGATELKLVVTQKKTSDSGLEVDQDQALMPVDVHMEGVSAENTIPFQVCLGKMMPENLNIGNYQIFHVEDGNTNQMELVAADEEFTAHNQFRYGLDGELTLNMATFSEVAVVTESDNIWNGNIAEAFSGGDGTEENPYIIRNADQLAYLNKLISDDNADYTTAHYKLVADIDFGGEANQHVWYPIGYWAKGEGTNAAGEAEWYQYGGAFSGTFDGNGNTISNIYQNTWALNGDYDYGYWDAAMGLFGYVLNGTVKNLTMDNFSSDGEFTPTGCVAAYAVNAAFEDIAITNCNPRVYNTGNGGIVGIGGSTSEEESESAGLVFKNITIDNTNKISALWGSWDVACGGLVGMFRGPNSVTMTNCHVAAQIDVNNDVCGNYQYYWYRYSGMLIGTNKNMITDADGYTVPETDKFYATDCTVHFGDWNEYWYCELVKNSLASYTHDHQFSRLTKIESVDEIKDGNGWTKEGNFVIPAENEKDAVCYHIFKDANGDLYQHLHDEADVTNPEPTETVNGVEGVLKEDKQHILLPFNQLFTGYGWGVKHIPIYDDGESNTFDGVTILDREIANSVEKFQKADNVQSSYTTGTTVTIGELFEATEAGLTGKTQINKENVQVFLSPVGDDSTASAIYTPNTDDWTQGTLTFSGQGEATISITDYNYCKTTTIAVMIEEKDAFAVVLPEANFLYRVGNANALPLNKLFEITGTEAIDGDITITATSLLDGETVIATATTTQGDFDSANLWSRVSFTGPAVLTIDAPGTKAVNLNVEVVAANNCTTASFSGSSVLLNDVSTSSTLSTSGVVYGNGFTVNMENAPISEKNGAVFHLYDGAILKNLNIVGDEYTTVAYTVNDTEYGVSAVRTWGTVVIENCYISGCRSAVSVTGSELTIKDSVIANGVYSNVDFRSGILNLHNVTTINEPHAVNGTTIVGLGIVGNMTASAGRKLNITGTLTQYNWVSQEDCANIKASGMSGIFNEVFTADKYAAFRYTYNGTTYVNAGIMSLCDDFLKDAVIGTPDDYAGKDVEASLGGITGSGYVWAPGQAGTLTADDMKYHDTVYTPVSSGQGTSYIPSGFDYEAAGLVQENGVVQISYESGSSYTLSNETLRALFTAQKYGQELPYTITMGGELYTNSDIVFEAKASGTYTITYTVTDDLVYGKDGSLSGETYEVTKELKVFATVVDKGADAPAFTFYYGTNGSASAGTPHTTQPTNSYTSTIKQVGEEYYIMPNVSATTANAIWSETVDGETIYYPIVDGINVRSGNSTDYDFTRYYPVFKAVTISDNGTEYSYSGTKDMPATVSWVSAQIDDGNGANALNDGFGLYNDQYLCKIQKKAGDAESGGTSVVKFSYVALDGNTYYYYVGFRFYDESEGCITGDTLITLADGTRKPVEELTGEELLLAWNLETGKYEAAPIVFVDSDAEEEFEIVHLYFSDGSDVKVIYEHGFFDLELGEYVYIDASNYADFIGHRFVAEGDIGTNSWREVTLDRVVLEKEVTTAWSPVTFSHLCYYTDGVLSMPGGIEGLFNIFEVDTEIMAYDAEKKAKDIETYGLFTFADFGDLITEAAYEAFNGAYLKVAIGKGLLTWEDIEALAERYVPMM